MTLSELKALREELAAERRSGAKRLKFEDREVEYMNDREYRRMLADLDREIAQREGTETTRVIYPIYTKGT
jgi:hypothetical protein